MHDLHVADKIKNIVLAEAQKNKLQNVREIKIELGVIEEHGSDILPENLVFNLSILLKNTIAEGALVFIDKVEGDSWKIKSISGDEK